MNISKDVSRSSCIPEHRRTILDGDEGSMAIELDLRTGFRLRYMHAGRYEKLEEGYLIARASAA